MTGIVAPGSGDNVGVARLGGLADFSKSLTSPPVRESRTASLRSQGALKAARGAASPMVGSPSEILFTATAAAKVWTSSVAMHLDRDARDRIFAQLDVLHELEEWSDGDVPIKLESFKTFVRAIIYHRINSRPSLALSANGDLLALWIDGADKLTIEFRERNFTRWFVQTGAGDFAEQATGSAPLERMRAVLEPYGADRWFDGR